MFHWCFALIEVSEIDQKQIQATVLLSGRYKHLNGKSFIWESSLETKFPRVVSYPLSSKKQTRRLQVAGQMSTRYVAIYLSCLQVGYSVQRTGGFFSYPSRVHSNLAWAKWARFFWGEQGFGRFPLQLRVITDYSTGTGTGKSRGALHVTTVYVDNLTFYNAARVSFNNDYNN